MFQVCLVERTYDQTAFKATLIHILYCCMLFLFSFQVPNAEKDKGLSYKQYLSALEDDAEEQQDLLEEYEEL